MLFAVSDTVWNAAIGAIVTIALAVIDYRSKQRAKEAADKIESVSKNVQKIETATNSMKDALVLATDKAAEARGKEIGIATAKADAAVTALGIVSEIARADAEKKQT